MVRQRENLLSLFNNWNKVLELQAVQAESAGLATQRYGIYLEGLESSANKAKAAWEGVWQSTINSDAIKFFYDLSAGAGSAVQWMGGLIPLFETLLSLFVLIKNQAVGIAILGWVESAKTILPSLKAGYIEIVSVIKSMVGVNVATAASYNVLTAAEMRAADAAKLVNSSAGAVSLAIAAVVAVIAVASIAYTRYANAAKDAYEAVKKSQEETTSNIAEINSLSKEYESLANKTTKTLEEQMRLLEIQDILNNKYGNNTTAINYYSDAMENNTEKIYQNIEANKQKSIQEAQNYIDTNKSAYEKAALDKKMQEERIKTLIQEIAYEEDLMNKDPMKSATGVVIRKTELDDLKVKLDITKKLTDAYESYINVLRLGQGLRPLNPGESELDTRVVLEDRITELKNLSDEYRVLSAKKEKTLADDYRLIDIQAILKDKYGGVSFGIDIQNKSMEENLRLMKLMQEEEQRKILEESKPSYESAKSIMAGKEGVLGLGATLSIQQQIEAEKIKLIEAEDKLSIARKNGDVIAINSAESEISSSKSTIAILADKEKELLKTIKFYEDLYNLINGIRPDPIVVPITFNAEQFKTDLDKLLSNKSELDTILNDYNAQQGISLETLGKLRAIYPSIEEYTTNEGGILKLNKERIIELTKARYDDLIAMAKTSNEYQTYSSMMKSGLPEDVKKDLAAKFPIVLTIAGFEIDRDAIGKETGEIAKTLSQQINELSDAQKGLTSIVGDANDAEEVSLDNLMVMIDKYPEYLSALYEENGVLKLNNEVLKDLMIAKAKAVLENLLLKESEEGVSDALTSQITAMRSYISALEKTDFNSFGNKAAEAQKAAEEAAKAAQDAYNDLLRMTIEMLKQEQEAKKKALQEELDGYKKIIDARKKIIDLKEEERKYNDELADKNKSISALEGEIAEATLDQSEEGKARRLKLEEDLVKEKTDLNDFQQTRSADKQKEALDNDYAKFEDNINKKVKAIDDYLAKSGVIAQKAMDLLNGKTDAFYKSLLQWNRIYGSGIDTDITSKWYGAFNALSVFNNGLRETDALLQQALDRSLEYSKMMMNAGYGSGGVNMPTGGYIPNYGGSHHSGLDSGAVGGLKPNEEFIKALKGEILITPDQQNNFMRNVLPNISNYSNIQSNIQNSGGISMEKFMDITVQGNLDTSVLPKLEDIVRSTIETINSSMQNRGWTRKATAFSI